MTTDDPHHPPADEPGRPAEGGPVTPGPTADPGHGAFTGPPPAGEVTSGGGPGGSTAPPADGEPPTVDELASALVDVALPPDEADAARQRPEVRARAGEMDAIRLTIRNAVPDPDPAARERAITAALAAFDASAPAGEMPAGSAVPPLAAESEGAGVADLATHRRDRDASPRRGAPRWLGAVAAIAVVLAGLAGVIAVSSQSSDDEDTAMVEESTQADEPAAGGDRSDEDSGESTDESSGEDDAAEAPAVTESPTGDFDDDTGAAGSAEDGVGALDIPPREAGDLGVLQSATVLVARMTAETDDQATVSPESAGVTSGEALQRLRTTCPDRLPAILDDTSSTLRLHARAELDRRPVDAWLIDTPEGRRVLALDASCRVVVDRAAR